MRLFEDSWKEDFNFYERVYDTELKKSIKIQSDNKYEWYEQSSKGLYSYILDDSIKLDKKLSSSSKDGRDKYGFLNPIYKNIRDTYWNKNLYNKNVNIWYYDIETRVGQNSTGFPVPEKALEEISLIQIFDKSLDSIIMLGLKDWKHKDDYTFEYNVKYITCKNEVELIETFLSLFKKLDPLIIYAWNGLGFDFPYIFNRMKNLNMDTNKLSNYGKVTLKSEIWFGKLQYKFESNGHFFIDLMEVYKNFVFSPRASYTLDAISELELGEKKVDHSCYSTFDGFYTGNYNIPINPTAEQLNSKIYKAAIAGNLDEVKELSHSEFCYYGYKDPLLIKKIDDKLNFTSLQIMIAEKMGVLFSDATATVKPWSQYILNKAYLDNKIIPKKTEHVSTDIVGGYVRNPVIGKHKWVLSADVNSMYPLLGMVGFNMSSETFVPKYKLESDLKELILMYFNDQKEENRFLLDDNIWNKITELLKKYNYSLGVNGAIFNKNKIGMIPELVQEIYNGRKQAKKTMFKYQQQKILIKEILDGK